MIAALSTVEKEFPSMAKKPAKSPRDTSKQGSIERSFIKQGLKILGVDEVGRGCIAGPVYAACVSLDYDALKDLDTKTRALIRDSKTLSSAQRQRILPVLHIVCRDWAVGVSTVTEIEEQGIVPATFQAMLRAFEAMKETHDLLLIDGKQLNPMLPIRQEAIIGGDGLCFAIAAASILAKEARDDFMRQAALNFPHYDFHENVGYGTKSHLTAMEARGITPLHRRNFAPVTRYAELGHYFTATV
ncbi:MAG TPA: ribonuclease HII [Oligoflexus sp.]|uniref:ribonuclease HII n=1 Tax=Oligoflexus sp. TaxID=1971216 RepID=UPI002D7FBABA|nr:ribonuclease HII [Oligoflexus sp.]HET9238744.1 ribonuclease HII [Oligoflexus sp.]